MTRESATNNTLLTTGILLLLLLVPTTLVLGPLGLSRMASFQSERRAFLLENYDNTTNQIQNLLLNTTDGIAQLQLILMQLYYGLGNLTAAFANVTEPVILPSIGSPETSMITQGTIRWSLAATSTPYAGLSPSLPNSTYRAYISYLDGVAFYVVAVDPPLNNGPIVVSGAGQFYLFGYFDQPNLFNNSLLFAFAALVIIPGAPPLMVNTTPCAECTPIPAYVSIWFDPWNLFLRQLLVQRTATTPDIHFDLPSYTNFYFFK